MLVLMEIARLDAAGPAGDQGSGAWLSGATQWLEAEADGMQGSWARQGQERAAVVCEGETEAYSVQTEQRDQNTKGGVQREAMRSPAFIYSLSSRREDGEQSWWLLSV